MKRALLAIALLAIALLASPAPLLAQGVEDVSATVRAEVDRATAALVDSLFDTFRSRDAERMANLYAKGEMVLHVSGVNIIRTDTILPYTARALAALAGFDAEWTPHSLQVLSPDIAVRTIRVTFRTTPKDGPAQTSAGVQTLILKRLPQGWRIVLDQRIMEPR